MEQEKVLLESLTQAFEEQELCDVQFNVEGKQIGAHKLILKSQCQVLFDLSANWTPEKDPFSIEDIGCESFKALLRYVVFDIIKMQYKSIIYVFISKIISMSWLMQNSVM